MMFGEDKAKIDELMSIKRSRMSPEKFETLCTRHDYKIIDRTFWFISPHYKAKFHLRPRLLWNWLGHIPYLRNWFTTSCFYVIGNR